MKKLLLLLVALIVAGPIYLIASGTISISSLGMILNTMIGKGIDSPSQQTLEGRLKIAEGFSLSLYAGDLPNARFITMTSNQDLLVTRPHKGEVLLVRADKNKPGQSGERISLLTGLIKPSGLVVADGWLYVGEADGIGRVQFDAATGKVTGTYQRIIDGLTGDGNHPYKGIDIGPDGKLYLAQGSTCNVCVEADSRRATMSRFNVDGSGEELLATGLRNTMGFDWAPWSGGLYATDNGRDLLGDDYPPCELNLIEEGQFYGWPYYNGANRPDPDFDSPPAELAANPIAPVHDFPAHNAPLGIHFINGEGMPADFEKSALVALHGSWNRSKPDGYKVVLLHWQGDEIVQRDFLSGFELEGDIVGRPVDITQGPDGAIYISDDYSGAIYRLAYGESQKSFSGAATNQTSDKQQFTLVEPDWLNDDNQSALIEQGEGLFKQFNCNSCHMTAATNSRLNLRTLDQRLQYDQVVGKLTNPTPPMPQFPLSETEKRALASYLMDQAKQI